MTNRSTKMKDTVKHRKIGFDVKRYKFLQKQAIIERMSKFTNGTLYLEIGGHFLHDTHAQRVLPGYNKDTKIEIFNELEIPFNIIFSVSAKDVKENRMLTDEGTEYVKRTIQILNMHKKALDVSIIVAINLIDDNNVKEVDLFEKKIHKLGYTSFRRYVIEGYPNPEKVISKNGYGKDEYFDNDESLTLVIGPASNSGKLSTCLGQVYHDLKNNKISGYAKFELFPIWNLPLKHPVNLAYEAATADIGDFNVEDRFHKSAHKINAVNYNRDVDAFPIIEALVKKIVKKDHFMSTYKSPTNMGINNAGFAITDDRIVAEAAYNEIVLRKKWYEKDLKAKRGKAEWVKKCEVLQKEAGEYIRRLPDNS